MGEREGERKAGDRGHSQVKWALTDMTVEVKKLKSESEKQDIEEILRWSKR